MTDLNLNEFSALCGNGALDKTPDIADTLLNVDVMGLLKSCKNRHKVMRITRSL